MCLIAFAFQKKEGMPLIVLANRDEMYERPTAAMHWWEDCPDILAGRDVRAGGTWMGINRKGDFAALSNIRNPGAEKSGLPSRGEIPVQWLSGRMSPDAMHGFLVRMGGKYNGFNLIYGNTQELYYYNNATGLIRQLYPGIYGISNALLDTPWPKTVKGKERFTELLLADNFPGDAEFLDAFHDTKEAPEELLPSTGVPSALEKTLSAMFIKSKVYGTRLTTFVTIDSSGQVRYHERSYVPEGDTVCNFTIPNTH